MKKLFSILMVFTALFFVGCASTTVDYVGSDGSTARVVSTRLFMDSNLENLKLDKKTDGAIKFGIGSTTGTSELDSSAIIKGLEVLGKTGVVAP